MFLFKGLPLPLPRHCLKNFNYVYQFHRIWLQGWTFGTAPNVRGAWKGDLVCAYVCAWDNALYIHDCGL